METLRESILLWAKTGPFFASVSVQFLLPPGPDVPGAWKHLEHHASLLLPKQVNSSVAYLTSALEISWEDIVLISKIMCRKQK